MAQRIALLDRKATGVIKKTDSTARVSIGRSVTGVVLLKDGARLTPVAQPVSARAALFKAPNVLLGRSAPAVASPLTVKGPPGPPGPIGPAGASQLGWAFYDTDLYTEADPWEVLDNTPAVLQFNGDGPTTDVSQLDAVFGTHQFVNGSTKFLPYRDGDAYTLRLNFTAKPLQIDGALRIALDIGGTIGVIFREDVSLVPVKASVTQV